MEYSGTMPNCRMRCASSSVCWALSCFFMLRSASSLPDSTPKKIITVDLEIEIAARRLRLHEELHAAIPANRILKLRVLGDHIAVFYAEPQVEVGGVVQEPG